LFIKQRIGIASEMLIGINIDGKKLSKYKRKNLAGKK